jgi:uncharacterized protein YkwD
MKKPMSLCLLLSAFCLLGAPADDYQPTREAFLERINAARAAAGVHGLSLSETLSIVAQERAAQLAGVRGSLTPSPDEASRRAQLKGYEPRVLSEILTEADGNPATVVSHWTRPGDPLASEILSAGYGEMGLGVSFSRSVPLYVLILSLSWDDFFADATRSFRDPENWRQRMLAAVNKERAARGVPPLKPEPRLDRAAQAHADDMLKRSYYSHETPEGKTVMARVQAGGYIAYEAGENIARGQFSIEEVMKGWMGSPQHREHLLSSEFQDVGFGLAFGRNMTGYTILWVQDFARPRVKRSPASAFNYRASSIVALSASSISCGR